MALIFLCTSSFGQNLKTYKGEYDDGTANKGNATYTYYEDKTTQEYIKHGAFKFSYIDRDEISSQKVSISGNYKHNKRDGIWIFVITYTDCPTNGDTFITGTKTLTATYSNGKPNGAWLYKYNVKGREKRYSLNGYYWTSFQPIAPELVSATYRDGVITGAVKFVNNLPYSDYNSIAGQFDQNGLMSGTWLYKSPEYEKTIDYKSGVLVRYIIREISSGKITMKEVDDAEMTQVKASFIAGRLSNKELGELKIRIDTVSAVANGNYNFDQSFKSADFRCRYIPGDETYFYQQAIYNDDSHEYLQDSGWIDTREEGKFYYFSKQASHN